MAANSIGGFGRAHGHGAELVAHRDVEAVVCVGWSGRSSRLELQRGLACRISTRVDPRGRWTHRALVVPRSRVRLRVLACYLLVLAHVLKGTQNFNISTATGTEIRADLHDAFMRWLHDFQEAAPLFATAVDDIRRSFILADMISPDAVAVQTAVRQADIIWCNNMLFPLELNAAVANMLRQCMSARAVVVSTAELQCMEQGTPLELRTQNRFMFPPDSMSWTGNAVPGFMSID